MRFCLLFQLFRVCLRRSQKWPWWFDGQDTNTNKLESDRMMTKMMMMQTSMVLIRATCVAIKFKFEPSSLWSLDVDHLVAMISLMSIINCANLRIKIKISIITLVYGHKITAKSSIDVSVTQFSLSCHCSCRLSARADRLTGNTTNRLVSCHADLRTTPHSGRQAHAERAQQDGLGGRHLAPRGALNWRRPATRRWVAN